MFVSASTECFRDLSLIKAMDRLADLEYTAVEFAMFEDLELLESFTRTFAAPSASPTVLKPGMPLAISSSTSTANASTPAIALYITLASNR